MPRPPVSSDTKDVLQFGSALIGVERSLLRWGYQLRSIPLTDRPRAPLPGSENAVAVIVDGSQPGAPELLQIAYEAQLPSVLVRTPAYLPGEKYAGSIYRNVPGPEEIRRAVIRLVSCPLPSRGVPIPSAPFLQFLRSRFGLTFPPRRSAEIREAVLQRMTALRLPTAQSYLERLERSQLGDREPDHLLSSLLVQETYIYRTPSHFNTIQEHFLPQYLARSDREVIRAWSAGCSTGEEAYSLGALLASRIPANKVEVIGSDVSLQALEQARFGRYSGYSIREQIPDAVRRFFEPQAGSLIASAELRRRVHFEYINLAAWADGEIAGPEGDFDLIFCRNVLLYFAPDCARKILQRLASRLRPGGLLFLGPSETVLGGETDLQVRSGIECFFLEKPRWERPSLLPLPLPPVAPPPSPPSISPLAPISRPPRLREPLAPPPPPWEERPAAPSVPTASIDSRQQVRALERGFRLLDQEDFPAARREFQFVQRADPGSHGARLGLLFLEANDGNYRIATEGTKQLSEEGAMLPELFFLRGILADQEGSPDEALLHFQRALFLDPNCLMGRLKLAEIHARTGDKRGSSREALNLLEQLRKLEPGSMVPLSGGLSREALEALCLGLLSEEKGR